MSTQPTLWNRAVSGGKLGFGKLYSVVDKLGAPVNKLSNKLGSEAFWPTSMDKECDKAARILRSFCKDGFYAEEERPSPDGPNQKQKVLKKIPASVIQNAAGLAIFTTMRTGLWVGGSGGAGVLVGRKADGSWSPPSGIHVQTMGLGFLVGVDIYDCVLVINTQQALEAFTRLRTTVGGDLSVTAGPVGIGGIVDTELHKRQAPIFTYLKSRGFYAGVSIDGTVIIERTDENERFYLERIPAQDILKGKVRHPPYECRGLLETLKAAEGDSSYDASLVPNDLPPSDYEVVHDGHMFGVPDKDDPDPYGVLQLEKEGMMIREAGTHKRASWEQFTYSPSLTSPVYDTFDRRSIKSPAVSRRGSHMSGQNIGVMSEVRSSNDSPRTPVSMSDMATQTDDLPPPPSSPGRASFRTSAIGSSLHSMDHILENEVASPSPSTHSHSGSWTAQKQGSRSSLSRSSTPTTKNSISEDEPHDEVTKDVPEIDSTQDEDEAHHSETSDNDDEVDDDDEDDHDVIVEAPVVHSIQRSTVAPKVIQKARMVTVPKRGPPPILPPRNPNRSSGPMIINSDRPTSSASQRTTSSLSQRPTSSLSSISATTTSPTHPPSDFAEHAVNETTPTKPVVVAATIEHEESSTGPTPEETPEEIKDPWSGVLARHESASTSQVSLDLPGAFHSVPASPTKE